jgi:hypothetical protein
VKVLELAARLAERDEQQIVVKLGDIQIADDASSLSIGTETEKQQFFLDDQATALLAKYLKIPGNYLKNCSPEFRATTLQHWRDKHSEADTMLEVLGDNLISIHAPHLLMLPLQGVAEMIGRVFSPEAEVRTFLRDARHFHVDVTDDRYAVQVPIGLGEYETTVGGVRVLAYPNEVKPPVVATYLFRPERSNGMVSNLKEGQIKLKGRTVSDVLDEMECASERVLATMDDHMQAYLRTADMEVPGTTLGFATQLLREFGLPVKVRDAVADLVNQLPANASVYDISQAITSVANRVNYTTQLKLQQLGGLLAFDAEQTLKRCGSCEQLLLIG